MSTDVAARRRGGRFHTRLMVALALALLAAAVVPLVGANATNRPGGDGGTGSSCSSRPTACARTRSRSTPTAALVPGFRRCCEHGTYASGNGLLTQAPPNTGAGWFTLATGAWPGVHGSTNNTFHINGSPFANSTAAFGAASILQAETLAQAAERGGKKVAQIEWAGGRSGSIQGPTLDFRNFFSGRGVMTNYTGPPATTRRVRRAFGVQFDHPPATPAAPFPAAPARDRLDERARLVQPRARRCTCGCSTRSGHRQVRPQRLHLRQPRTTARPAMTACCSQPHQGRRRQASADLKEGEWADVKVKIDSARDPRRQDRRVPGQGRAARLRTSPTCGCSTRR